MRAGTPNRFDARVAATLIARRRPVISNNGSLAIGVLQRAGKSRITYVGERQRSGCEFIVV
jgi:hypothetical protein